MSPAVRAAGVRGRGPGHRRRLLVFVRPVPARPLPAGPAPGRGVPHPATRNRCGRRRCSRTGSGGPRPARTPTCRCGEPRVDGRAVRRQAIRWALSRQGRAAADAMGRWPDRRAGVRRRATLLQHDVIVGLVVALGQPGSVPFWYVRVQAEAAATSCKTSCPRHST